MKAICTYFSGSSFDNKKGTIVEISELHISRIWRAGKELDISDLSRKTNQNSYLLPQEKIQKMVEVGDHLEDNYCHGQYEAIAD